MCVELVYYWWRFCFQIHHFHHLITIEAIRSSLVWWYYHSTHLYDSLLLCLPLLLFFAITHLENDEVQVADTSLPDRFMGKNFTRACESTLQLKIIKTTMNLLETIINNSTLQLEIRKTTMNSLGTIINKSTLQLK